MRSYLALRTPHPSAYGCHLPPLGKAFFSACHICGGGASTASGGFFDEPIGSACEMPQGGLCKPPDRLVVMTVYRKPPALLVVPKSFSFAQFSYPSEARNQAAFSCGRRGTTVVVDEELPCVKNTSSVSLRLPPSPTGEGIF